MHQPKHTPGPWRADDDEQIMLEDQIPMLLEDKGTDREWVSVGEYDEEGMLSVVALCHPNNARLIAAAPAMYEALQGMLDWARRVNTLNPGPEILNALNVIAQAEGRQ